MKKFFNIRASLISFSALLLLMSCQEEFEDINSSANEETMEAGSQTANLMVSMAIMDGSYDNIVDGSSCFAVQFPYTVQVNGIEIIIDEVGDLQEIEAIFDWYGDDDDRIEIEYPITVTSENFEDILINSEDELEDLLDECEDGEGDEDDIECIDIVYPVTMYTFDLSNEVTETFEINSDRELHQFFKNLNSQILVSVDFPVELVTKDGSTITVNSLVELALALSQARDDCDEDDDNDYNDDDDTEKDLKELLLECPWAVHELVIDRQHREADYQRYLIDFKEDGSVFILDEGQTYQGSWSIEITERNPMVILDFPDFPDLNIEGMVYRTRERIIKIYAGEGKHLKLRKRCDLDDDDDDDDNDDGDDDDEEDNFSDNAAKERLNNLLKDCPWVFRKILSDGVELPGLEDYVLFIKPEGQVEVLNEETNEVFQGTWFIEEAEASTEGARFFFNLEVAEIPELNFRVPVRRFVNGVLEMEDVGIGFKVFLERRCNADRDGDLVELTQFLKSADWKVATYEINGDDVAAQWEGYEFDFERSGELDVDVNDFEVAEGKYRVARGENGGLKLILEFDEETPLPDFNYYWDIVGENLTETSIEVVKETANGSLRVVFAKIGDDDDDEYSQAVAALLDYLVSSTWGISTFSMFGNDVTAQYDGFEFNFDMEDVVTVTYGENTVTGSFEVYDLGGGELKLELDFEEGTALSDLDRYWYFDTESFSPESLEVTAEDGGLVVLFEVLNTNSTD